MPERLRVPRKTHPFLKICFQGARFRNYKWLFDYGKAKVASLLHICFMYRFILTLNRFWTPLLNPVPTKNLAEHNSLVGKRACCGHGSSCYSSLFNQKLVLNATCWKGTAFFFLFPHSQFVAFTTSNNYNVLKSSRSHCAFPRARWDICMYDSWNALFSLLSLSNLTHKLYILANFWCH